MKATIRNKTALTLAAGLAALVVTSSPAAAAALTWDGSASMNWNTTDANWGGAWTNGSDAVFGATGVGTVTLGSAVTANSVAFNATGYTIAGSGGNALTINSGGITANAAATISAPVTLGAEQSWIVPGASGTTELTVSGNISGTYGLTIGSLVQTLSSSTFLTTTAQNIFPGVQLSSITAVAGQMGGGWVNGGTPLAATGYFWNLSGTTATYQLQTVDVGYAKAVLVTLTQNGADVYARETAAKYVAPPNGVSSLGTNASNSPWLAAGLAQSQGAGGYGVFSTTITTGQIANGTVVLSGTNSYNGPTKVLSGTARFAQQVSLYNGSNGSWTAANIDVKPGATLALNVGGAGEFTAADIAILAGLGGGTNGFESGASLGLDTTNAGGTFTCGSALANPNGGANALGLNKLGGGNLVLTGGNSYTGPTVISAGTLTFNCASAQTIGGAISGAGTLNQAGPGTLTLNGGNSYTGGTIISGGVLKAGTNTALGTQTGGNVGDVTIQSGATLDINGRNLGYGITLAGSGADGQGALVNTGGAPSGSVTQTPNISLSADAAIGGSGNFEMIQVNNAANSLALNNHTLTKFGTNTFYLSNTTVGAGTIHIAQGVFSQDIGYGVSSAAGVAFVLDNTAGVTLAVNGADLTIGSITGGGTTGGNVTLGNRMLTVGGDNSSPAPYAGTISGTGGSLTKVGSGTLTLSGANPYSGTTTVNGGTLALGANNVLPDGSGVAIGAGTLDAATFTDTASTLDVTGAATINLGTGAALAFANSSAVTWTGTLNITGTLGATSLRFGNSSSGLTEPQLALVSVNGGGTGTYTLDADGYLVAGGPRPEIAVEQPAGTGIPSGSGWRDFGTVTPGSNTSLEFTIRNPGTADLNLTGTPPDYVVITGTDASDFTVTSQPSTPVASGGGTTTFTVRFAPGAAGARNAALSIANDDTTGGEDPFVINLSGTGRTPYDAWADGAAFGDDTNGDGIRNGLAFLLGTPNKDANALGRLPLPGSVSGKLVMTFDCLAAPFRGTAVLNVQYSKDLGQTDLWTNHEVAVPGAVGSYPDTGSGVSFEVTANGGLLHVAATVAESKASADGKLFGRLSAADPQQLDELAPVQSLIERIAPGRGQEFVVETIPAAEGRGVFELESRGAKVAVRGDSPLSVAVGFNWYLKYYANSHVSLNGSQVNLPQVLPAVPAKVRMSSWAASRYFLNYCTFAYSMPWWDWAQWERFIDWMALNGINQPLAITGQEAVWQAVCRRFGLSDAEINAFLAGPPYLPFQWMGCLDSHGGPLPEGWIEKRADLQKKILARERGLGMTPVLQGFTGHAPKALLDKFPGTQAQRIDWQGFYTWMLDPADPLFGAFGTAFIEEQTRLFGTDHLYDADSFIEMTPPSGDLAYLTGVGRAIYQGMAAADPQAVWVLMSWPFHPARPFWTQDRVQALLSGVPDDRMLVLDLHCDVTPLWKLREGFFGKPWVWNFICNFGNNTILRNSGALARFNDLAAARNDPFGWNLRGVGMMMEGFDHNPLNYDLMFELAWRDNVDLQSWVRDYARFRYGKANADAQAAWETLRTGVYSAGVGSNGGKTIIPTFPNTGLGFYRYPSAPLTEACRRLLQAKDELGATETYRHDLVNITRQALSSHAGDLYLNAMSAVQAKDAAAFRQASAKFLELIRDLDGLLATNEEFLLGAWLEDAKRWGATDAERAKLEWNARNIITRWGPGPALPDYAWKEWSGLLTGFHGKRWEIFFRRQQEALDAGTLFDAAACRAEIRQFEDAWCLQRELYPSTAQGDSVAVAQSLCEKYLP